MGPSDQERAEPESSPIGPHESRPHRPRGRCLPPTYPPSVERPAWLSWLLGGNTLVRVGVVILFFGVAFLLKYAYEHTHVPIEVRLTGVATGAIVLLFIGWRLRLTPRGYALALQGGGVGVLYLTVFAAFRLYGLLPPERRWCCCS